MEETIRNVHIFLAPLSPLQGHFEIQRFLGLKCKFRKIDRRSLGNSDEKGTGRLFAGMGESTISGSELVEQCGASQGTPRAM